MSAITLVSLNMLLARHGESVARDRRVPLGPLYLTRALEDAGITVDFRDMQLSPAVDPFAREAFLDFCAAPAPIVGLSCMANLLPFAVLAARWLKERDPACRVILGGVGATGVEGRVLERFPWIDAICRGEGEITGPELIRALQRGDVSSVDGISYRVAGGRVVHNPDRARIENLDAIPRPAFHRIDFRHYAVHDIVSSRGCPCSSTSCSVGPVWDRRCFSRSPANLVEEMKHVRETARETVGVMSVSFQDESFASGKRQVLKFCRALRRARLYIYWEAYGRVNVTGEDVMSAMSEVGCTRLRFNIESGCDAILTRIKKGFTARDVLELIPRAVRIFRTADISYTWGFPFETMAQFHETLFQMVALRTVGARILPSLFSFFPQTGIYQEIEGKVPLELCPYLMPGFVLARHEVLRGMRMEIPPERHAALYALIEGNPDIFPGFFHVDVAGNVLPKLRLLQRFGFYPELTNDTESRGAHSPRRSGVVRQHAAEKVSPP